MAAGNRSVLAVLDSRAAAAQRSAEHTIFAALEHIQVVWEVLDRGDTWGATPAYVAPRALYVLAHDGAGAALTAEQAQLIAGAVAAGAGLVSFDHQVDLWPAALRELLPGPPRAARLDSLRLAETPVFITRGHEPGEAVALDAELEALAWAPDVTGQPVASAPDGAPVIVATKAGAGRLVLFGTGHDLWSEDVWGHARWLDGLLWRALVWAAAKPFPMRCLPPYVTARIDDCNGTYAAFDYVRVMNRYGIGPNLGLFIDELGPSDWAAVKELFDAGAADFSMHAFRDDYYMSRPNYRPFAVSPDKPDLSRGGQETVFEGLSLDHETGLDLPLATVRHNFERMDQAFARAGIRHSRVLNAHFGEVGFNALPLFLERGVDMPCNNTAVGQLYGHQPVWRPRPYGLRSRTGRHGLVLDRAPQHPGMMFISSLPGHLPAPHGAADVLVGRVPYLDEAPTPLLDEAIAAGLRTITMGLDALSFGMLFTHEERINAISPDDWERVVAGIVRGLDGWDVEFAEREEVGIICRRLLESRLVRANCTAGELHCELTGTTDGPSPLTIWDNDGDDCLRRVVEVEPLAGYAEVRG